MFDRHLLLAALALAALAADPLAQPAGLVTAERATQTVELAPGPNVVSLYVAPDDPSMAAVLSGLGENLRSVKDPGGAQGASVYAPARGVQDLTAWDWRTAYVVDVEQAARLEVSGARIDPSSPVPLAAGWNYIPYLHSRALPADAALASVADAIDWGGVANSFGPPAGGMSGAVLEPGRGYRIYSARQATLVYAAGTEIDADLTAPTVADALALRGLEPGQTVWVQGYYAPGDGGGGVFDVTESGRAPDGGTVFVPLEHQSEELVRTAAFLGTQRAQDMPDGQDVVFGSLTLDLLDRDGDLLVSVSGEHLHGHTFNSKRDLRPLFSYEGGVLRDFASQLSKFFSSTLGRWRDGRLRFTYRHTTSDLRLERRGVGFTLDVTWFGARTESESPGFDNQPVINQALNVAQALNAEGGRVEAVVLPKLGVYGYFGTVEIPDGLTVRGAGGTYLATETNDLGHTYRPVRIRPDHTRLRLLDGEALTHVRMEKDEGDPAYLPPDAKFALGMRPTRITVANNIASAGLEDIVLDGNWEGNMQAWDEGWATSDELEGRLRNSPNWSGFTANNHGKDILPGQQITVRNAAILGYAATGLLGSIDSEWTTENVLVGDALYNHAMYGASGTHTNLTLTGFAWGHVVWVYGTINNFVFERGQPSPIGRNTAEVIGIRGGDAYDPDELVGQGLFTRSDETVPDIQTQIVGFYADLRGSGNLAMIKGLGPNITIRGVSSAEPGRIVSDLSGADALYYEGGNGHQRALYPNNRIEHVVLHDLHSGGPHRQAVIGNFNTTDSVVRDVRVERPDSQGQRTLTFAARRRNHPAWDVPQVQLYEQIQDGPTEFIARVTRAESDAAGMDVFIRDSEFDNRTSTLYAGDSGTGELSKFDGDPSKLRVYMEGVTFNVPGGYPRNLELFFATTRFRGCTDARSGRTSESSLTLRASDFSGLEATAPLDLLWAPHSRDYVAFSGAGASAVESWEIVDAAGNALGADQRDPHVRIRLSEPLGGRTITVDAAVRPWEDGVSVPESLLE